VRRSTAALLSTAFVSTGLLLGACAPGSSASPDVSSAEAATTASAALLARHGLAGDGPAIVERLEALPSQDRPRDLMVSVRPGELQLSDGQGKASLPLPRDRFYLSVAPYVDHTHECHFHSLTTCQGEMMRTAVHLTIRDASGAPLVDKDVVTNANGFVGSWLPKGSSGTVEVVSRRGRGTQPFSTEAADDPTCMTTLRLTSS
jgi:hypothetical protein